MRLNRLHALLSAVMISKPDLEWLNVIGNYCDILIDSGAYTNYTTMLAKSTANKDYVQPVKLDWYIDFCKQIHGRVWNYIALDVHHQREKTDRNLQTMLDAGLLPMPVFISVYNEDDVYRLLKINDHICLADLAFADRKSCANRIRKFDSVAGEQKHYVHGLGFGKYPDFINLPLYTSDSSSFLSGQKYGNFFFFDSITGFSGFHASDVYSRPLLLDRVKALAQVDYKDFVMDNLRGGLCLQAFVSCLAYLRFSMLMHEYDKYFFIATDFDSMVKYMAVAATANADLSSFPYHEAKKLVAEIIYEKDKSLKLARLESLAKGLPHDRTIQ